MTFWNVLLFDFDISFSEVTRFGEDFLSFFDPHRLKIELVERETSSVNTWEHGKIHQDVAIQGFGGAVLYSTNPDETREILAGVLGRSEERRVGKECRSGWWAYPDKEKGKEEAGKREK